MTNMIYTWHGLDIRELQQEELITAFIELFKALDDERASHARSLRMAELFKKAKP